MKTLKQLRDQVRADLDVEEDDFIIDSDINTWIREGVRQAESQILTLYERYFLVEHTIPLSSGVNIYDYPTSLDTLKARYPLETEVDIIANRNPAGGDIFANKIVRMVFNNGDDNSSHVVQRVKDLADAKTDDIYFKDTVNPTLRWLPVNDLTNGRKIRIFPAQARSGELNVFYIRNARKLLNDTDECDIDEFEHYVVQYAKTQAYLKDGDPRTAESKALEEQYKNDMIETLSDMAPSIDDKLDMDFDHYSDSV